MMMGVWLLDDGGCGYWMMMGVGYWVMVGVIMG